MIMWQSIIMMTGDANHLILDAHAISPPPPELSPPSIIPTTEETYKGQPRGRG